MEPSTLLVVIAIWTAVVLSTLRVDGVKEFFATFRALFLRGRPTRSELVEEVSSLEGEIIRLRAHYRAEIDAISDERDRVRQRNIALARDNTRLALQVETPAPDVFSTEPGAVQPSVRPAWGTPVAVSPPATMSERVRAKGRKPGDARQSRASVSGKDKYVAGGMYCITCEKWSPNVHAHYHPRGKTTYVEPRTHRLSLVLTMHPEYPDWNDSRQRALALALQMALMRDCTLDEESLEKDEAISTHSGERREFWSFVVTERG